MLNIIIPAYNCKNTLGQTLASLQAQTKNNFIVTIVDDNSEEDLSSIINYYNQRMIISYIKKEKNEGPGLARQTGFDNCERCNYVMFVDADDMLLPRAVEVLYGEAKKNFADVVFSEIKVENDDGTMRQLQFGKNTTWFHGKIYSTAFLRKLNIDFHNVEFLYNEDSYFNLITTLTAERKFYLEEVTYFWRNNKSSLTRKEDNFIYKYNKDYIMAQISALNFIFNKFPDLDFNVAPTILNLYSAYELECLKNFDNIEEINIKLYKLMNRPEFLKLYNNANTMLYIIENAKQGRVVNSDILYYRHSFASFSDFFGITLGERK